MPDFSHSLRLLFLTVHVQFSLNKKHIMKGTNKNKNLNIIYLNGFCQDVFHKQNNHFSMADHRFFHDVL